MNVRRAPQLRRLTERQLLEGLRDGLISLTRDGTLVPTIGGGTANTSPIFTLVPNVSGIAPSAANTKSDGTGTIATDIFKAFTAGTNGSFVAKARFSAVATVAATSTGATVGRVFVSSKTSGATTGGTDTFALGEVALPVTVADSSSAPTNVFEVPINFPIPAGWTILVTNHAAPQANTSWQTTVFGGDY